MPRQLRFIAIACLLSSAALGGPPPNCAECAAARAEMLQLATQQKTYADLLTRNQAMIKTISPDDVSKKIKLTSNLLILASKVETLANNQTIKKMESDKKGCASCPIR